MPLAGIRIGQAYTCFVAMPRNDAAGETGLRVVELDGGRVCPVDWGECSDLLEVRFILLSFLSLIEVVVLMVWYRTWPR